MDSFNNAYLFLKKLVLFEYENVAIINIRLNELAFENLGRGRRKSESNIIITHKRTFSQTF